MKTVAVLIPTFLIEYSTDFLNGIYEYFKDKDVRVIITQTKFPHSTVGVFDYQYWTSVEYLKAHDVDAYIVVSGVYTATISTEQLEEIVSSFAPRPVISMAVDLNLPRTYSIQADCKKSFSDVVGHLKNVHGCKKFAFCSANSTKSGEAIERYDAFTLALEEHSLVFDSELVIDGGFTDFGAKDALKARYHSKDDINFDAIICANDMMAIGCIDALKELEVKIPDGVKVVGFDDAIVSKISNPKLSTINQSIFKQGFKAAHLANEALEERVLNKKNYITLLPKFRQSCGCISCDLSQPVYKNIDGEICSDDTENESNIHKYVNEMSERNKLIVLMDTVHGTNTLKQFFFNLRYIADQCHISCFAVNFFNDVVYIDSEDNFTLPKEMNLGMLYDRNNNTELFKPGVKFNPRNQILSSRTLQQTPGVFILHPIFNGESNYGYMLCKVDTPRFADYIVYFKIIVTALAQSCEYTNQIVETEKLQDEKNSLTRQSRTDELTNILNRRGFIEQGQSALDVMQETGKAGVIFFADMDGLKKINDTYGHEAGDLAIKLQAKVLKSVFRSTDVVGRLSGDEFGIVAVGMHLKSVDSVRLKVDIMNQKFTKENKLPFDLSISLGAVDLQKSSIIKKLLAEADKSLYEEKRKKRHARLSQDSK